MNQDRLFAHFLITEVHTRLMMAQGNLNQDYLSEAWSTVLNEGDRLELDAKEKGLYFRGSGSVFSDYKLFRESSIPTGQGYMKKTISPRFSKTMTAKEILAQASGIISEWHTKTNIEHEI